jgi:hypothetical protein
MKVAYEDKGATVFHIPDRYPGLSYNKTKVLFKRVGTLGLSLTSKV